MRKENEHSAKRRLRELAPTLNLGLISTSRSQSASQVPTATRVLLVLCGAIFGAEEVRALKSLESKARRALSKAVASEIAAVANRSVESLY